MCKSAELKIAASYSAPTIPSEVGVSTKGVYRSKDKFMAQREMAMSCRAAYYDDERNYIPFTHKSRSKNGNYAKRF